MAAQPDRLRNLGFRENFGFSPRTGSTSFLDTLWRQNTIAPSQSSESWNQRRDQSLASNLELQTGRATTQKKLAESNAAVDLTNPKKAPPQPFGIGAWMPSLPYGTLGASAGKTLLGF